MDEDLNSVYCDLNGGICEQISFILHPLVSALLVCSCSFFSLQIIDICDNAINSF